MNSSYSRVWGPVCVCVKLSSTLVALGSQVVSSSLTTGAGNSTPEYWSRATGKSRLAAIPFSDRKAQDSTSRKNTSHLESAPATRRSRVAGEDFHPCASLAQSPEKRLMLPVISTEYYSRAKGRLAATLRLFRSKGVRPGTSQKIHPIGKAFLTQAATRRRRL